MPTLPMGEREVRVKLAGGWLTVDRALGLVSVMGKIGTKSVAFGLTQEEADRFSELLVGP